MAKRKCQQKKKKARGGRKQVDLLRRQVGLLVTKELQAAIDACKKEVERIAKDCRERNVKYRDPDFDLTRDWDRCIYGMRDPPLPVIPKPSVRRVTEIFDKPKFFNDKGAAEWSAIRQGGIGDCYFLAGLGTVCCLPGLMERVCVARDDEVGVYGFIFFQDDGWCRVIVDDLLPVQNPRLFDSLNDDERRLFVEDRDLFHRVQRNQGSRLTYAKSGTDGETWVPLIEKAYAKLYGSYEHLDSGWATEAIEDLTGGVSSTFYTQACDILDRDRFWKQEMSKVNTDRLLSATFFADDTQGLLSEHSYSVLKAIEWNGKRFVLVLNPWGNSEWEGPWSDGSKEWEPHWLGALKELDHVFGDDGKFVMEYDDFLKYFERIGRTFLFDESWVLVSEWMKVDVNNIPELPSYGSLSFKLTIPEPTKAIICLSKLNTRSFKTALLGPTLTYEFAIVKVGERKPLSVSSPSADSRVALELDLEAGTYMIYVKTEHESTIPNPTTGYCNPIKTQTVAKLLASKVKTLSLVKNWDTELRAKFVPKTLEEVIEEDLVEDRSDTATESAMEDSEEGILKEAGSDGESTAAHAIAPAQNAPTNEVDSKTAEHEVSPPTQSLPSVVPQGLHWTALVVLLTILLRGIDWIALTCLYLFGTSSEPKDTAEGTMDQVDNPVEPSIPFGVPAPISQNEIVLYTPVWPAPAPPVPQNWEDLYRDAASSVFLGLRVYTQTKEPCSIIGRVRSSQQGPA